MRPGSRSWWLRPAGPRRRRPARLLEAALGLWRGPALAEFADRPWAQAVAARLEELRLAALESLAEVRLAAGDPGGLAGLVGELEGLVAAYPTRERLRWVVDGGVVPVGSSGRRAGGVSGGSGGVGGGVGDRPVAGVAAAPPAGAGPGPGIGGGRPRPGPGPPQPARAAHQPGRPGAGAGGAGQAGGAASAGDGGRAGWGGQDECGGGVGSAGGGWVSGWGVAGRAGRRRRPGAAPRGRGHGPGPQRGGREPSAPVPDPRRAAGRLRP